MDLIERLRSEIESAEKLFAIDYRAGLTRLGEIKETLERILVAQESIEENAELAEELADASATE